MSDLFLIAKLSSVSVLLIAAAAVIIAHCLLWIAYLYLKFGPRRWMARLFDPDSFPRGSFWEAFQDAIRDRLDSIPREEQMLASPTRKYWLGNQLAAGDLCDVYHATARERAGRGQFVMKIPRVTGCDRLLKKEQNVLRRLQEESCGDTYAKYFPVPVESFRSRRQLVSVSQWREGHFTAEEIRERFPTGVEARHLAWMFNRTLEALGFVHECGWVHGAVLPPHLLFDPEHHGMQLVGWTHATPMNTPLHVVSRRFKSWFPPECHRREAATPQTDINLAVKSMIWLAGGDPLRHELPDHLPMEISCFLKACLSRSQTHGADAWALHEQFRELLEGLYGPPKFCHISMS